MSSKDTEKNFVGQPIFKQPVDLLPKSKFDILALEHKTDRYYKAFPAWTQLVTMLLVCLADATPCVKFAMECWRCKEN